MKLMSQGFIPIQIIVILTIVLATTGLVISQSNVLTPTPTPIPSPSLLNPSSAPGYPNPCPSGQVALYEGGIFSGCATPATLQQPIKTVEPSSIEPEPTAIEVYSSQGGSFCGGVYPNEYYCSPGTHCDRTYMYIPCGTEEACQKQFPKGNCIAN